MILSILVIAPVSAGAKSYDDYFTVNSPTDNSTITLGSAVEISVTPHKYLSSYWTAMRNYPNFIGVEIFKGEKSVYSHEFIYNIDGKAIYADYKYLYFPKATGVTQTDTFEPTETGKYTVQFRFWLYGNEYDTKDTVQKECTFSVVKNKEANPITVKTADKTVKIGALKKAAVTVKPITISKAKGTVTVKKVKKGTTESIYDKISVNKTTGAVTFKKGTYKAGTYKIKLSVTAAGNSDYKKKTISKTVSVKIVKDDNPMTVAAAGKSVTAASLKKAAKSLQFLSVKKAKGTVTYQKVKKGTTESIYDKISVNKTTGKVTIKKGAYKKGTYKIKLSVKAAGNGQYKAKTVTKTVAVKIK